MTKLEFHGPFHFDEINKSTGKIEKDEKTYELKKAGIYIWGFAYYFNKHGIIAPVNFRNSNPSFKNDVMKFIPYYVGKSNNDMYNERMIHHHEVRNKQKSKSVQADKYTRLSHGYMTEFFKDKLLPLKIGTSSRTKELINLVEQSPSKIIYHNDGRVLREIYPNIQPQPLIPKKENPITKFKIEGIDIPDTLEDLVDYMNNFWFCYAIANPKEIDMEDCETFTFFSLKGKTLGKTESFEKINHSISINASNINSQIFKDERPSKEFPGY